MSHKVNDEIKEYLQEAINGAYEIASFTKERAQKALDENDLETAIDIISEGTNKGKEYVDNVLEEEYSDEFPLGGVLEPYDIDREDHLDDDDIEDLMDRVMPIKRK